MCHTCVSWRGGARTRLIRNEREPQTPCHTHTQIKLKPNQNRKLCETPAHTAHKLNRLSTFFSLEKHVQSAGNSGVVVSSREVARAPPAADTPTPPHQTPERRCPLARHARALGPLGSCSLGCACASHHHTSHHSCQSVVRNSRIFSRLSPNISCACRARARGKPIAISCCTVSFATWLGLGSGLGLSG